MRRVCLVGAGFISQVHAEVIRATPRILLHGVIDPNLKDARATRRDILSRGLKAEFDCGDAKRDLGWQRVTNRGGFIERGIRAFATQ